MNDQHNTSSYEKLQNRIKLNIDIQDGALFADQEKKRIFLGREKRAVLILGVLTLVLFTVSVLLTTDLTNHDFSLAYLLYQFTFRIEDIFNLITGNQLNSGIHFFICQFAATILAGAALAVSGASFQGIFRNPMASPTLLGVQSGGQLGAAVYVLFCSSWVSAAFSGFGYVTYGDYIEAYKSQSLIEHNISQLFVLAGCILVVTIVVFIAKRSNHGRINTVSLMLGGTVFTGMITTLLNMVQYYLTMNDASQATIEQIRAINAGRFTTVSVPEVLLCMALPIVICLVLTIVFGDKLNVIVFGEDEARTMGMNVERYRMILIALSTVLTATVVAFCGTINFVGLIVPQFARFITGPNFKYLIPASAFLGAIFMLLSFDITYMLGFAINISMVVNCLGGMIFLITMIRYRRQGNADWT